MRYVLWEPLTKAKRPATCLRCCGRIERGDQHSWRPHRALFAASDRDGHGAWSSERLRAGGDSVCEDCGGHLLRLSSWHGVLMGVIDDVGGALESRAHRHDFLTGVTEHFGDGAAPRSRHWRMQQKWYRDSQLLALRRAIDYDEGKPLTRRNHSLLRLLAEMGAHPETLSGEHLGFWLREERCADRQVVQHILNGHEVDCEWLLEAAATLQQRLEPVRKFVNQRVAHRAASPQNRSLSYADIDEALDAIAAFVEACAGLLTISVRMGQWDMVEGASWGAILRHPSRRCDAGGAAPGGGLERAPSE